MSQLKSIEELQEALKSNELELAKARKLLDEKNIQLEEATDTIEAIRAGEVDALVIRAESGPRLYTLKGSDHTYRIIIEQMSEGAVTINRDGLILYSNSRFASMIGIGMEKITGHNFSNFVSGRDVLLFSQLFSDAWNRPVKAELLLQDVHQIGFPVLASVTPLHLEEGVFLSVILTDLTIQKETQRLLREKNDQLEEAQQVARSLNHNLEATVLDRTRDLEVSISQKTIVERELRRNQEQLTRILETMAEGVTIIDNNGELIYANPMAQKILGITLAVGENIYRDPSYPKFKMDDTELVPEEDPLHVALRTGKPVYDFEIAVQLPSAARIYISVSAAPLTDEQHQVIGSVGTFMDVTNRRKVIQQKDEFISVASHELKTPVTSLKASLQLLDEIKDKPEVSSGLIPKLITQANKSLNRLSVLIEDLLNVSKIRGGQLALNRKIFLIYDVITECCEEIHRDNRFNISVIGEQNVFVHADPDKIAQVISNFLNNAMKYAADSKDIRIVVARLDNSVKVSVIDRGMGIPAEKVPHLFDRYYRVDNSGTQYSGLGLGLYICSEIIKKHDGEIGVDSTPQQGSTFWFTLPVAD